MSRIDDMIAKYCPDGVEFRELQEVFITRNGYTPSTTNKVSCSPKFEPVYKVQSLTEKGLEYDWHEEAA